MGGAGVAEEGAGMEGGTDVDADEEDEDDEDDIESLRWAFRLARTMSSNRVISFSRRVMASSGISAVRVTFLYQHTIEKGSWCPRRAVRMHA